MPIALRTFPSMPSPFLAPTLLLFSLLLLPLYARAATSYISDFVDPDYVSARHFDIRTYRAQITILRWARELARSGPWTITNRTVFPPSGDKHDYMSWISSAWPNCTSAGNTTVLIEEEVWRLCTYENKDEINPDTIPVNTASSDAFDTMSDAILYNSIASAIVGGNSNLFSRNAVTYLQTWFLDPELRMNPNLDYAQMKRGLKGLLGQHGGIMELRGFVKIVSGVIILRSIKTIDYTQAIDQGIVSWCSQYIQWLETSTTAIQESMMVNYHATFYYAQLASLKILVNDWQGAMNVINTFASNQFMNQIDNTGEQPLEQNTFDPQRHRIMNLAALITLARLAKYADPASTSSELWNKTTSTGGTIQLALDFAMSQARPTTVLEGDVDLNVRDLDPLIAAIGSTFGDPDKRYQHFLLEMDPNYAEKPYFLWNQPFAGGPSPTSDLEKARMTSRVGNGAMTASVELVTVTQIVVVVLTMHMLMM